MAMPALARPAASALDRALDIAQVEQQPVRLASALNTLKKMVCCDVLPLEKRARVLDIARARLLNAQTPGAFRAAVELAVMTGDPHLRLMVSGIANGLVQPAFLDEVVLVKWARSVAQRTLHRYYRDRGVLTANQPAGYCNG